jgi:hypothetical protein
MFNHIGSEIQTHDPHHRLLSIHDDSDFLPDEFYGNASPWNTLGQYSQYSGRDYSFPWSDHCAPPDDANCKGRFATPRDRQTLHEGLRELRVQRNRNRPVINGEYAFFLRRNNPAHPMVVTRGHSHNRSTFRKAAWALVMAGTYIVPGFWRTYYGGWAGENSPFQPDDPEATPAVQDLQTLQGFMTHRENGTRREWWKLTPHDELVSSYPNPGDGSLGNGYCLADPGLSYVVYTENTRSTELILGGSSAATYRIIRFDPRTATRTLLKPSVNGRTAITLLSPDTEDWVYEVQVN